MEGGFQSPPVAALIVFPGFRDAIFASFHAPTDGAASFVQSLAHYLE